jgi:hypothetical protein
MKLRVALLIALSAACTLTSTDLTEDIRTSNAANRIQLQLNSSEANAVLAIIAKHTAGHAPNVARSISKARRHVTG